MRIYETGVYYTNDCLVASSVLLTIRFRVFLVHLIQNRDKETNSHNGGIATIIWHLPGHATDCVRLYLTHYTFLLIANSQDSK